MIQEGVKRGAKPVKLHTCQDGTILYQKFGNFDGWQIIANKKAPRDLDYFTALKHLGDIYGNKKVMTDFNYIFHMAHYNDTEEDWQKILDISKTYTNHINITEKVFSILYLTMIVEEHRPLPLGKRIKKLAAYEILIKHRPVSSAVNAYRGVNVNKIKSIYIGYGLIF